MKNLSIFCLAIVLATIAGCNSSTSDGEMAVIKAEILNADGRQVFLEDVNGASAYAVDTAVVKNNKVVLSAVVEPGMFRMKFPELRNVQGPLIFLNNESRLEAKLDVKDPSGFVVSGDAENELLLKTLQRQDELAKESIGYKSVMRNTSDEALRQDANRKLADLIAKSEREMKEVIEESKHLDPNLTAFMLNLVDPSANLAYITAELNALKEQDPNSKLIAQMHSRFAVTQQRKSSGIAIGDVAPDIVQNTPDGKPLALSSLRGKYVLIDFWASWCRPCRFENPNVVRTYNQYKELGFDVFSVSLDKNKDRWEKAIQEDDLVWPNHVSDLQAWSNAAARLYGVGSIPATFLIDPEGKVIARNLRGPALENKLKEVLGDS